MISSFSMRVLRTIPLAIGAFLWSSVAAADDGANNRNIKAVGIPSEFSELTRPREAVVDVYFGGRKIGETRVEARPGFIRFRHPAEVVSMVPNIIKSASVARAVASELPANAQRVCPEGTTQGCGALAPEVVGVIFNEDQFRLDLFINPQWLAVVGAEEDLYLSTPTAPLSLTSSTGMTLSDSDTSSATYNIQNRAILGFRNARIRSDSSYASDFGLVVDNLVAEIDRPERRYSAGLFWAPGVDLIGQRRIVGVGVGTQFDTRADRASLRGTPLVLFLGQAARVDVLIDGRLVDSRLYEAGNNALDTARLPDGSYSVLLRIQEQSGAVREERRFVVKNPLIAPVGQPLHFAYAGLLANTRPGRAIHVSKSLFYQIGTSRRLSNALAVDVSVIGTNKKPMFEAGAWVMAPFARLRAAALASASGDRGALFQLASAQSGPLTFNFDLRRIWSRDGRPLIPLPTYVDTFRPNSPANEQLAEGSYTQATGSVGYRLGSAYLGVLGSLRKDNRMAADYSVGPHASWPVINTNGLQVTLQADAQLTRTTTSAFVGFRIFYTSRKGFSTFSTFGRRGTSSRNGALPSTWRAVGGTTAHYSYRREDQTELALTAGLDRDIGSTTAQAAASLYSRLGSARGEIRQGFEGDKATQYGLTLQTGTALSLGGTAIGGRHLDESALLVSLAGAPGRSEFEVMINEQPRGRVRSGRRLALFLQPYRAYKVRLRPVNAPSVWYVSGTRELTLYPGNVEQLRWEVERLFTVFGRAVRADASPVANTMITSKRGLGQSDAAGYFQIEVTDREVLSFADAKQGSCKVAVDAVEPRDDYVSIGKVVCQ